MSRDTSANIADDLQVESHFHIRQNPGMSIGKPNAWAITASTRESPRIQPR